MTKVQMDELVGLLQDLQSNVVDVVVDNLSGYLGYPNESCIIGFQVAAILKRYSEALFDWSGPEFNETMESIEEAETGLKQLVDQFIEADEEEDESE
jgi:hypothetical protein